MATYKGRKVTLNKPRRIGKGEPSYGKKKSVVYVKDGDKVKRVTFGDPNMKIKKNQIAQTVVLLEIVKHQKEILMTMVLLLQVKMLMFKMMNLYYLNYHQKIKTN